MKKKKTSNHKKRDADDESKNQSVLHSQERDDPNPPPECKNNRTNYQKDDSQKRAWFTTDRLVAISEILVALATIGTLYVVYSQTLILEQQLISGQRAWVTLKQADHTEIKEGKRVGIKLVFINSGNSPAMNLTINSNAQFRSIPVPTPMPLADECAPQDRSRAVITPHEFFFNIKPTNEILTKQQVAEINDKKRRLYAWGRIEYDDIFGEHHRTDYCVFSQPGTLSFTGCENNNAAN